MSDQTPREYVTERLHSPAMKCQQCDHTRDLIKPMPEEIWQILLAATMYMENNDNSMSQRDAADAERARDWLMEQETDG